MPSPGHHPSPLTSLTPTVIREPNQRPLAALLQLCLSNPASRPACLPPITLSYLVVTTPPVVTSTTALPCTAGRSVGDGQGGIGEQGGDVGEELGALLAVHHAVVDGQGQLADLAGYHGTVHHPRHVPDRAEGEDR